VLPLTECDCKIDNPKLSAHSKQAIELNTFEYSAVKNASTTGQNFFDDEYLVFVN